MQKRGGKDTSPAAGIEAIAERGPAADSTRDRIKAVAAELYVQRGHDGFSFGDIATVIGVTRANIHHHFGNKQKLMAELIEGFTTDARTRIEHHWARPGIGFSERLKAQRDDLRRFYDRHHRKPEDRNVWSPISRLRLDLPVLGEPAARSLEKISRVYETSLTVALDEAVESGELTRATPVADLVQVLRVLLLSCPPITQDSGSFGEIDKVFAALDRIVVGSWGAKAA